ncbi:short chain dehydrogenase [Saccharospirillum sp. MSK14-1]|uniref:SDR family NAD(P)-dependent oxidoreductase n=1 Tax=Saccharospirillum sp. MSK14-1 TaxID=1897632 RepID=UPI000D397E65|nr:SDR family NAD(P)-dependent oxidoreductase [Saccharospirillum sp. MSK14-1]PTY37442.1 short chain dehydrogenase [Saccharospirillum sp. MSK14-1]
MSDTSQVAIITGGASGLGQAVALKLADQGNQIVLVDINEDTGQATRTQLEKLGVEVLFVHADVSRAADVKRYVDTTVEHFGRIDLFFNNAGISGPGTPFVDNSIEQIDEVLNINLRGALYGLKYVLEVMLKQGAGTIVNMASSAGLVGIEGVGTYSATKHGMAGITKTIAVENAKQGIRINAVAPGATETPLIKAYRQAHPDIVARNEAAIPQQRFGSPEEVAELVAFLFSDAAPHINGTVIPIDGGFTAQ